ncbi:hypothetical protein ORD22_04510 [Sporosarcina sp. GW1-11]|uniref:hypothetical protein n=1 Tax=Sporosarcina sp. GW1-11 TaxID=2899126 RepID=UPI00294CE1C0|nr:hypothetical protein [Sporosarcina sp. GW1-11]MDV6377522.1 hypothetical protein [Sporosarcina sp. GW1-11]
MTDRELLQLIADKVINMEGDILTLKTDVSSLKTDVSSLKTDVSSLKTDVSSLKTDVSTLKTDVSTLKTDVSSLKEEQKFIKQAMFEIGDRTITTEGKIDLLTETVSHNTDQLASMRTIHHQVNDHDIDIRMIKKMLIQ